jgi:phospholipase C
VSLARGHDPDEPHDCVDPATGLLSEEVDKNPDTWTSPPSYLHRFHETRYCTADTAHNWTHVHDQWDGGAMDGFVNASNIFGLGGGGGRAIAYYDHTDLGFYYWLSSTFALSDRHFCSLLGPTWPNRWYLTSATSFGRVQTPDVPVSSSEPTLMNRMQDAGRSTKIYRDGGVSFLVGAYADPSYYGADMWDEDNTFGTTFEADVAADALPDLAFLDPSFSGKGQNDEHPPSNIQKGQALVARVIKTLASNPTVWAKTVLIVTYDEHGGYYDHVEPPPACEPDEILAPGGGKFDRLGVRIPLLVVSPFAKAHYVSHLVTDLTSVTRFVENRFDLPAMTRRDANAWPMLDLFDFGNPPFLTPPAFPWELAELNAEKEAWCQANNPGTGLPEGLGDPTPIPAPGSCSGVDPEPNGSQLLAAPLPDIDDCDFGFDEVVEGVLAGKGDVDFFLFKGEDKLLCAVNPKVEVVTPDTEVCIFVACFSGSTTFLDKDGDGDVCNGGTQKTIDSGTTKGCCVNEVNDEARVEYDCTSLITDDDSADVYIRVRAKNPPANATEAASAGQCMAYEVQYHF